MVLIIEYGMQIDHFMAELTKVCREEKPVMIECSVVDKFRWQRRHKVYDGKYIYCWCFIGSV